MAALVFPFIAPLVWAQTDPYQGKIIRAIEYVPAAQPLTARDLSRAQLLKIGQPYRKADVSAAIDRLFTTGRYDDIQADVESRPDGVAVRFLTRDKSFIGHVEVTGKIADPPSRGQLNESTQLNLGAPFEAKDVEDAQKTMLDLFRRNGLYEATVTHRLVPVPATQQMQIVFEVNSNRRARYNTPVITGDPKLTDAQIIKATHWRRFLIGGWKTISQTKTRSGITSVRNRYTKKNRLMAKIQLQSMDYDPALRQATPKLNIDAGPTVDVRAVEAKLSQGKLKTYVPVFQEHAVDRDLLVEGARNLRDYFQSQGYYEADINFREMPKPAEDKLTVEYVISKGQRHRLVALEITGNKYFSTSALQERLILRTASFQFRHGRYSEAYRKQDVAAIENLYKSNGFRDAVVTADIVDDYKGKTGDIAVTYRIDEGAQWFIESLDVAGVRAAGSEAAVEKLVSVKGQPFSEFNVAADRKSLLDFYFSHGYPNARFQWNFDPGGAPNHVNVRYEITEGAEQFVRDVLVTGLHTTRPELVRKNITLQAGEPLSQTALTNSQRRLYDLGIFAKVDAAVQNPDGNTMDKYVQYDIDEASRYTFNIGVGAQIAQFGPTTNNISTPTGNTGFSPEFTVDVSRINLWGIGHTIGLQGRLSTIDKRAIFNYYAPRFRNREGRSITFSAIYDDARDIRTFSSKREEASVQVAQKLSKPSSLLVRFAYRRVTTSDVVIPALLVPQLLQPVRLGILSANYIQDRRDNPADTHRGIYNTLDVGLTGSFFGSTRSFGRVLFQNATYHSIGSKNWVLARELTFGVIAPFNVPAGLTATQSVPLPERFFGGGSNSQRGFGYNEAGPRDVGSPAGPGGQLSQPTGFPLGGNAVFFHKTELRFPLIGENIGGVLFHDMGNVFDKFSDISLKFHQDNLRDFNTTVHAVGFGIRYRTPVGPVRLDLAYSINPPSFNGFKGTYQQLLQCNPNLPPGELPSYCTPVKQTLSHFQFFFSIGQTF